jgi:cytochrome c-type biogenesis protein CcmF
VGYVGFSVAFAFACAAMLEGKLDQTWARWTRPWTTVAWMFLTVGIALGSWWAYYELGWGGYWAWDPVENSILMPWLLGTALIHSLSVTDKRGLFKSWTLLLAIMTFSFCLLATFMVRSGVLVSVHSFASDPARGIFILTFLVLAIGGALTLYVWRAPLLRSEAGFDLISREAFLLFNNILLVVATAVVFGALLISIRCSCCLCCRCWRWCHWAPSRAGSAARCVNHGSASWVRWCWQCCWAQPSAWASMAVARCWRRWA